MVQQELAHQQLEMKQIKEKRNKSNMCTWLIIVLLAMYMYLRLNFLITFSDWWIALCYCGVFLVFMLLFYLLGKSITYLKIIEISTIAFFECLEYNIFVRFLQYKRT